MKKKLHKILLAAACCTPLLASAQIGKNGTYPEHLYQEGRTLFEQKAYTAALTPLNKYLKQLDATPEHENQRMETEYMLVCIEYEMQGKQRIEQLQNYLERHPDTPHSNRIHSLIGSSYFFNEQYDEALAMLQSVNLDALAKEERDDAVYRLAISHLQTGNLKEAAIWLEALRSNSSRYEEDCTYYLAYIRYTQGRYEESMKGFLSLQESEKYQTLVPYYLAEVYQIWQQYDKATHIAENYLSHYPGQAHEAEMYRILGTSAYHSGDFLQARQSFQTYLQKLGNEEARRDALYMLGLSCYHNGVYSEVPAYLLQVTRENDELTQNAYLHTGLAYLQLADKNKARMAFEQAAVSNANRNIKEQAAYNYALCLHETSYSAFGESVNVFEKFLNEFPQSPYADRISSYLVDVYMSTRSYEAALQSIERIQRPSNSILEAKQRILFQLGTQAFTNAQFPEASHYFSQSITLGNYNQQTKADAYYWRGEACYRMEKLNEAKNDFQQYQTQTLQRQTEMYALSFYNLGYIFFRTDNYAAARERFINFVQKEKEGNKQLLADAYNRIGDCYLNHRSFDEAKSYYARAEQQGTHAGDYAFYQLALVAGLQKDYQGKVNLLNQLVQKYPQSPYAINALYEKGRSYVQNGQNLEAISTFQEMVQKYPENPTSRKAAAEIGLLYYQQGDYNRAIDAYKQVAKQYPGSEEARLAMRDLKSLYVDANRVDEFAALAAELPGDIHFEANEQDSLTYIAAEKVYMKGDGSNAKNSFNRYLQSYPEGAFSLNAHYYLSILAKEEKEDEDVLLHTGKVLEYPNSPYAEEALLMHSEILFNRQQYAEAMNDYKQLQAKATTTEKRQLGNLGVLRCAALLNDRIEIIQSATSLLAESKLSPEWRNEALYYRGKAYLQEKATQKSMADFKLLAKDTRTLYGAEAKYLVAQQYYDQKEYAAAEKELLNFIEQSTPHAYWLARAFVLLSDVYVKMDKKLDARQYLLSLQQNYQADDDIASMIETRLEALK